MDKPYVVSADIYLLMKEWASQKGFMLPEAKFIADIRNDFCILMREMFNKFEFIPEIEIKEGIAQLVLQSGLMPLSLDRVYFHGATHIETSRLVDKAGNDFGIGHRANTQSLIQQFRELRAIGVKEVALVDDVLFTGSLLRRIINCLAQMDINVPIVCAGIGIAEGIRKIGSLHREVRCVRIFENVIDEVCERDFYPGVPFCGRQLVGGENIGVPYLFPFGNPEKWASIPIAWQTQFSKFCIEQSIRLFEEIEKCSKKIVQCAELGRFVVTLPKDDTRFVNALRTL